MLERDAILSKVSIVKNCLATIQRVTSFKPSSLDDILAQDVFVLNLQRSIQASIDMAHILISQYGWKLPASYKESFHILGTHSVIKQDLVKKMQGMCGFRNIAVHEYQDITVDILKSILKHHLQDFEEFYSAIFRFIDSSGEANDKAEVRI